MKLYLVQHSEARSKQDDPKRPLTEKGKSDANRLAVFLRQAGIKVEHIIYSGKLRTQQTAERLVKAIAPNINIEVHDAINPNDNPVTFAIRLKEFSGDSLIVGHLPFLPSLIAHLVLGNKNSIITEYTPGSIVCLEFTAEKNNWSLNWMIRPELLN